MIHRLLHSEKYYRFASLLDRYVCVHPLMPSREPPRMPPRTSLACPRMHPRMLSRRIPSRMPPHTPSHMPPSVPSSLASSSHASSRASRMPPPFKRVFFCRACMLLGFLVYILVLVGFFIHWTTRSYVATAVYSAATFVVTCLATTLAMWCAIHQRRQALRAVAQELTQRDMIENDDKWDDMLKRAFKVIDKDKSGAKLLNDDALHDIGNLHAGKMPRLSRLWTMLRKAVSVLLLFLMVMSGHRSP